MTSFKATALAAMTLATSGSALAQPVETPPVGAQGGAGDRLANDGPYAGASRKDFYQPEDRIKHAQALIQQGALAGARARQALAQLAAIHQDLNYRIARHNGDLRDWDRELINQKLDALMKQYPALGG